MTHTETINGKEVIFETVEVAERIEHSTTHFMDGYTGGKHTHTAIGSFAIGSDDFEEISYIDEVEDENSTQFADGYSVDGDDMHWTVCCPECEKEFEYQGYFDSGDETKCKCGCTFRTRKVWIDDSHYIE